MNRANQRGFTIIEVIIAVIVLTIGLLGLVTTAALVTRMIGRGQRAGAAAAFAARRLERLRITACVPANRVAGSDTLRRGTTWIAVNNWTFSTINQNAFRIKLVTKSRTIQNRVRVDSSEASVPCN